MPGETSELSTSEVRLQEIIAEYLAAEDQGQPIDRATVLARYPEFGTELTAFLDAHERVRRVAEKCPAPVPRSFPRSFGDYELLEEIGRGGMGVVYKARHRSLNRTVALKVMLGSVMDAREEAERLGREARILAGLDHPNIVPVYDVGEAKEEGAGPPMRFLSMKLIEGKDLTHHLADLAADPRRAVQILIQVARAVHHAHKAGIVHRDLKPANVLLDSRGEVFVTDFGLARYLEQDRALTRTGAVVGTPAYMAPEQALGERALTPAIDVYSLGVILYELLTGRPPFLGETPFAVLHQVVGTIPLRPKALRPDVDRGLDEICVKCLAKDPRARYRTAEALADALERSQKGEPAWRRIVRRMWGNGPRMPRGWPTPRRLLLLLVCWAALLGLVIAATERRMVYPVDMLRAKQEAESLDPDLLYLYRLLEKHRPGWATFWIDYRDERWYDLETLRLRLKREHSDPFFKKKARHDSY